jgi:hypothetical protein
MGIIMPSNTVKSFAEKSGKPVKEVERLWNKAKGIVEKQYSMDENDDNYYALVTGTLKKMLSIEESSIREIIRDVIEETLYN